MIHMDIHPWNVFVDPERDELTAIIDWGDASWGDPALEFASMPMQAMPAMLEIPSRAAACAPLFDALDDNHDVATLMGSALKQEADLIGGHDSR